MGQPPPPQTLLPLPSCPFPSIQPPLPRWGTLPEYLLTMGLCRSYGLVAPWGIWARMWALLSPPLACLGVRSGEELRQLPPVGELDQGLQPQTTCPYTMAVVLAKQERRKLQGLGPGSCQVHATNTAGKCAAERPHGGVCRQATWSRVAQQPPCFLAWL